MTDAAHTHPAHRLFDEYLRRNHKRRTSERVALLDCVLATKGHFSVEALCSMVEQAGVRVSVATVYNTVELLVDCGLVVRHRFDSKSSRYEKAMSGGNHHHLVCTRCGKIKEMRDADLDRHLAFKRYVGFTPTYFAVNIYGVCAACRRKSKKEK